MNYKSGLTQIPPALPERAIVPHTPRFDDSGRDTSLFVATITLTTTPYMLVLPKHNHAIFQNAGVNTLQYSKTGDVFFDWIDAGNVFALDGHRETRFFVQAAVGTIVLRVSCWLGDESLSQ